MYHPVPLNWMAGEEIRLTTGAPHLGHFSGGLSLALCSTSHTSWHLVHWYSYIGIIFSSE